MIESIYKGATARMHIDNQILEAFEIQRGIRQGDPISPKLFITVIEQVFKDTHLKYGIDIDGEYLRDLTFAEVIMSAGPGGPGGETQQPREQSKRLQQTQAQVDEVVNIMRVNVEKVIDRDQKISQLDDRAEALQAGASQFEASAGKLKRKYWWKNCKMWLILIGIVVVIIIIIVVWVVTNQKSSDGGGSGGQTSTKAPALTNSDSEAGGTA
ncbi:vesicle-associated membrane protein 3 [Plakobranchus ocellatus]|uniref:Vesicle-associated membrane protein 3 n=1 Tax=Plakobranchus ocellatus TaxID=259542 RepID=A0AAV3ZPF2_9GAST|nr:vesicle-associated membrane protein 3 [Plakobranchus ocellatus]